jgi:hypothetical protein
MLKADKIKRVPNKVKRTFMQIPIFADLSRYNYQSKLEKHLHYLPKITDQDEVLVESLHQKGTFVTSWQSLQLDSTHLMLASCKHLLSELLISPSNQHHVISIPLLKTMQYPEIFLWGLEERILNSIENYIGLPILYHGVELRREIANGELIDVRQWHIDVEDYRMVKIIIYLNDVNLNGGPFEYISKDKSLLLRQTLKYNSGFVSDHMIEPFVPKSYWQPCTGSYGTVIFSDTCNVFHRAKPPVTSDRFSITFSYTSQKPIKKYSTGVLPQDEFLKLSRRLSQRQSDCITANSRLF